MIYEQLKEEARGQYGSVASLSRLLGYKTAKGFVLTFKRRVDALNKVLSLLGYELSLKPVVKHNAKCK